MDVSQTAGRPLPFQTLRAQAAAQPLVVDSLLAVALSALSIFTLLAGAQDLGQVDPLNLTLLLLQTVPLAVRRRWPVAVFLVTFGALVVQVLVIQPSAPRSGRSSPCTRWVSESIAHDPGCWRRGRRSCSCS